MPSRARVLAVFVLLGITSVLAGCGSGSKASNGSKERFVYTTIFDCEAGTKFKPADCSTGIDAALAEHQKKATKHATMRDCEAVEGLDRCEKLVDKDYQPRLMAYLFAETKTGGVAAIPLYSGLKGATVFRDGGGKVYDWERTVGVVFSPEAKRKAEGFLPLKKK